MSAKINGDTEIILNFIQVSVPDDHPAIHHYITSRASSQDVAVNAILKLTDGILTPPYTVGHVRTIIRRFLRGKKKDYLNGDLKIGGNY